MDKLEYLRKAERAKDVLQDTTDYLYKFAALLTDLEATFENDTLKKEKSDGTSSIICDLLNLTESLKESLRKVQFNLRSEPDTAEVLFEQELALKESLNATEITE